MASSNDDGVALYAFLLLFLFTMGQYFGVSRVHQVKLRLTKEGFGGVKL